MLDIKKFSSYTDVFCDSYDALISAYELGLSKKSYIYSNAPSVIMKCKNSIYLENFWNRDKLKKFQSSINIYSKKLYDQLAKNESISHEESLVVLQTFVNFQKIIYKSACLSEKDLSRKILLIEVDGNGGPKGNNMNTPWSYLLQDNKKLKIYRYKFYDCNYKILSTHRASIINRAKLGGMETFVYRFVSNVGKYIPKNIVRGLVLIPSENELVIESSFSLIKFFILPVKINSEFCDESQNYSANIDKVKICIEKTINERINKWVCPVVSDRCAELFYKNLEKNLSLFYCKYDRWTDVVSKYANYKSIVISNSMSNPSLTALSKVCFDNGIPVVTTQHGITAEINALHLAYSPVYESNYSDVFFAYNGMSKIAADCSYYKKGKTYVSGISSRHLRVKSAPVNNSGNVSLVYVSNNLYTGNMYGVGNWITDLEQCKNEIDIISSVLSKIPFDVTYKTYPEDNKRYSDPDPALLELSKYKQINVVDKKVDMRFLLPDYDLIMSTTASSTLAWLILTEKPLIYIHRPCHAPLNSDAHSDFSKSIFLFNAEDDDYANKIVSFLLQPYERIVSQWQEMHADRQSMINKYVSSYTDSPRKRVSQYLFNNYFS
jgi:hypothetical protein